LPRAEARFVRWLFTLRILTACDFGHCIRRWYCCLIAQ
jgi:hypothetical protein